MHPQPMLRSVIRAAACGIATALFLAACSGGGSAAKSRHVAAQSAAPVLEQAPLPEKVDNDPSVRKNVVQTKCEAVPGGWGASGTAANPGTKPVTYAITVYFTTTQATTLDYAETKVTVEPGKSADWKAEKKFHAQEHMLCPMPGISVVS